MFILRPCILTGAIAFSVLMSAPAAADDCQLKQVASLPVTWTTNGHMSIPVDMEDTRKNLILDTGAPASIINKSAAEELHLVRARIFRGTFINSSGGSFDERATVRSLTIDHLHAENTDFLVSDSPISSDDTVDGLLGVGLLQSQDIEFDFADNKINLFSQDHCPGKVIYWPADAISVVPIQILESGHIIVPALLDGKKMDALFDTGSPGTFLSLEGAHNMFDLHTADLTEIGHEGDRKYYKHRFKTLTFEGITINNPELMLSENETRSGEAAHIGTRLAEKSQGDVDLILGLREMRHFRIYIAYKEKKLYITAGGAAPAATSAPAP